ncbi:MULTISPECIES: DUF4145 domain-containing protein [Halomonadaceae]|uniref:DUF4145 domain-containing protein n=1 Tax=Halomonadaceae TaxID=28256 RepID=UPI000C34A251|nr:DUF4145 domain-containing protein [Halomonas sp. MES3-P3E]PKG46962.1 DUF4145 domain-containing protein [Halomonas sp. MES3-P3E]
MDKKISKRFIELEAQAEKVAATHKTSHSEMFGRSDNVDSDVFLEWRVKVKNLMVKVGGENSEHYKEFSKAEEDSSWSGSLTKFKALKAVFLATKEDFDGGYLSSYKAIVQAEVFDTELEQAYELLKSGYYVAAAVIGGVVLETALRELCDREGIAHGKMDKMNADLTKAGTYTKIVQKHITAFAGIRNSAAHGNTEEFSKSDVEKMLTSIEQFIASHID